jgi:hypothetical protein
MAARMSGNETLFRIPIAYEYETKDGRVFTHSFYLGPFNSKSMCETQLKVHQNRCEKRQAMGNIDLRYFRTGPIETPTWNIA